MVVEKYFICCLLFSLYSVQSTPLDDYVFSPDPHYGYTLLTSYNLTEYNLFVFNFTSQQWYDESVSSRSIWWHYLCITVPNIITKPDVGFLFIDGNSNTDGLPKPTDVFVALSSTLAVTTGMIGVELQQIPNAPIIFKSDPTKKSRDEDQVLAWTFKKFMENTTNTFMPAFLPIAKACVRAMNAGTEIAKAKGVANITSFIVAGASKRGWAAWMTAAVDKRVIATIPIVMDLLNINTNFHHHFKSLGGWTFAFKDFLSYNDLNITASLDTPEFNALLEIVDPFTYLNRFKNMKLLLINSAGDEYFIPDDSDYFWMELRAATNGSALVRRLPNAEHTCAGHLTSVFFSMRSFFLSVYRNEKLPSIRWIRPNNATHGVTVVTVDIINGPSPFSATVFYAQTLNNKRRDFRLLVADPKNPDKSIPNPVFWQSDSKIISKTETQATITYSVAFPKPLSGWLGFFFQLSFHGLEDTVLEISSEVNIIPEYFPFPDCYRETCFGSLV